MKKTFAALVVLFAASAAPSFAQTVSDLEPDFRGRLSVGTDIKLMKGFHLDVQEEFRFKNSFSQVDRSYTKIGLSYKFNNYIKAGAGYGAIFDYKPNKKTWKMLNRVYAEVTGMYKTRTWTFSLREKFQLTNVGSHNEYESPANKLALKSRLQAKYRGFRAPVNPYVLFEARTALNDPRLSATYNKTDGEYTSFDLLGYDDAYFNRYRGGIGFDWKMSLRSALDVYFLLDYVTDKEIDVKGTELKTLEYSRGLNSIIGLGYTISF